MFLCLRGSFLQDLDISRDMCKSAQSLAIDSCKNIKYKNKIVEKLIYIKNKSTDYSS